MKLTIKHVGIVAGITALILVALGAHLSGTSIASLIWPFFLVALFGAIYFIPTIVAREKKKRNSGSIFVLNLFLGWTFLGWVVALIWAATQDPESQAGK